MSAAGVRWGGLLLGQAATMSEVLVDAGQLARGQVWIAARRVASLVRLKIRCH